jgi:pumilio homology domain family member 6
VWFVISRVVQLVVKHDGSRVIQTCLKYGTHQHRTTIYEAFKGKILDLAKDKYAHHLAYKLFKYGSKSDLARKMLPELMGSFEKLIKNKVGWGWGWGWG